MKFQGGPIQPKWLTLGSLLGPEMSGGWRDSAAKRAAGCQAVRVRGGGGGSCEPQRGEWEVENIWALKECTVEMERGRDVISLRL